MKPSQVNTEPGTKTPPDTVHKLAAAGRIVETSSSGISHERWREEKREGKCMVFGDASMSAHIKLFSNMQKDFSATVRKTKNGEGNSVILLEQEVERESISTLLYNSYLAGSEMSSGKFVLP